MQPVSPADAIGLAFTRARSVLAQPFRAGRFLKIALVAALTQATYLSVSFTYPVQGLQIFNRRHAEAASALLDPGVASFAGGSVGGGALAAFSFGLIAVIILVCLLFGSAYLYVLCRLRFVLFDFVVFRQARFRAAWSKYGRQTWRYMGLLLLVQLALWTAVAVTLGPFLWRAIHDLHHRGQQAGPILGPSQIFGMLGIVWMFALVWLLADTLLQDLAVPSMALEDAPLGVSLGKVWQLFRDHPGRVLLYIVLRFVVGIGLGIALMMAALVVIGLLALACFALGLLLYHSLWTGGFAARALFVVIAALMATVVIVLYLLATTCVYGITGVFKASYAAEFLGGYYGPLGALIEPEPPISGSFPTAGAHWSGFEARVEVRAAEPLPQAVPPEHEPSGSAAAIEPPGPAEEAPREDDSPANPNKVDTSLW